ncbi:glutathione S-transferase T3-like [Zingiber officinale]|uniref:glutathione S-transferase T3-like n=1 Tax=Zingiber officinale TaxID=94328 RepID=UPI001C4A99CA|nr:glutathione S-transferase T3-like [Zingiber officinale]
MDPTYLKVEFIQIKDPHKLNCLTVNPQLKVTNLDKADSNTAGRRKRSTWSKVKDEVLARSFVTISDDPIIDNYQKVDVFWGRIASNYNENRPLAIPNRIASVIRSHWHNTIQIKVYPFNTNYNSIYSAYHSGHSNEDILRFAYEKYHKENNGNAFNLEHVWRIVKDRPIFTPQSVDHLVGKDLGVRGKQHLI